MASLANISFSERSLARAERFSRVRAKIIRRSVRPPSMRRASIASAESQVAFAASASPTACCAVAFDNRIFVNASGSSSPSRFWIAELRNSPEPSDDRPTCCPWSAGRWPASSGSRHRSPSPAPYTAQYSGRWRRSTPRCARLPKLDRQPIQRDRQVTCRVSPVEAAEHGDAALTLPDRPWASPRLDRMMAISPQSMPS